ncbi:MAG: hypothetical protein KGR26_07520 [Cyanobacteria bacterium REEB65]|nr:hypothetical protein [Cyanobacteria bacterium REEB65]
MLGWGLLAGIAGGCQKFGAGAAVLPTATLTGTALAPASPGERAGVGPAMAGHAIPLSYARVQALDARLRPIPGVSEARTDAGGHFALDVPTGRPYILRFTSDMPDHRVDQLAVADPTYGDGGQLITADAAMHVATEVLLDRARGTDSALQAIGASDVQALVAAVRRSLPNSPMDLASTASSTVVSEVEGQVNAMGILARVDQEVAQAQASASAAANRQTFSIETQEATPVTTPATDAAATDLAPPPVNSATPAPVAAALLAPAPGKVPPAVRPQRTSAALDRRSLLWAQEFSANLGAVADPYERALRQARVDVGVLKRPSWRSTGFEAPARADRGGGRPSSKAADPVAKAARCHGLEGTPHSGREGPRLDRSPRARQRSATGTVAARIRARPRANPWVAWWTALVRWMPIIRWPTLALQL